MNEAFVAQILGDKHVYTRAEMELAMIKAYNQGKANEYERIRQAELSRAYDY